MIPYFILLLVVVVLSLIAKKARNDKTLYRSVIFSIFLVLVLFAGLRDESVGTDTNNYIGMFQSDRVYSSLEIGYLLLQEITKLFSSEYWVLLTIIAIIVLFFYLKTILILSGNYTVSLFVFMTLATYLFFFNGARQGIAAAIFSFSIIAVVNKDYKRYYLWIAVAFLFHKSVLVTLPFYYLLRKKYSFKNLGILIVSLSFMILLFSQLLTLLPDTMTSRYSQYVDRGQRGGELLTIFHMIILSYFIFMRQYISRSQKNIYDIYLNMVTIFTLIFVMVSLAGLDVNLLRMSLYFSLGSILIWPIIFKTIRKKLKPLVMLFFIIGHLMFFYIYIGKMSDLYPFSFNSIGV
ncbi:MAG: hypothetical protein DRQ78_06260 [Epsilonproteobacteria bacterium]|nr:MAG: hypothetical protein DRQ78_06260 [Campylobacterota bacterium]